MGKLYFPGPRSSLYIPLQHRSGVPSARSPIGLYQEIAGAVDMAALHEALDEGWSARELDDLEGDLDEELRAR